MLSPLISFTPPLRIAAFGSGSGSNIRALLDASQESSLFTVTALFCDRPCGIQSLAEEYNTPLIFHNYRTFSPPPGEKKREAYDKASLSLLSPYAPDLLVLAGYMLLVSPVLLAAYRILNVHPADLNIYNREGERAYTGLDTVFKALTAGETSTCSSVHLVNEEVDGGALLVRGPSVFYKGPRPVTAESALQQQEQQKQESDWPALLYAVRLIAERKIKTDKAGTLYLDQAPLPQGGVKMRQHKDQICAEL